MGIMSLEGKIDLVLSKLGDLREDNQHTRNTLWEIGIGLAMLIIGVVAAAPAICDLGMKTREVISQTMKESNGTAQ